MAASSSTSGSGKRQVTSEEITELAKLLPEGKYSKLFNILGFEYSYHQKILGKRHRDNTAAAEELLEEWKEKTHGYMEVLDEALEKAEVGGLIPKYKKVLKAEGRQHISTSASSASTVAHDTEMGRIATTKELKKLASLLYADFYTDLAVNLGLEPAEFDNIRRENPTLTDANFKMLLKWKAKENSGLVEDLDRALVESGCGALAKEYKQN